MLYRSKALSFYWITWFFMQMTTAQEFRYGGQGNDSSTCYYHMHIPKTGGASLRKELASLFERENHRTLISAEKRGIAVLEGTKTFKNCTGSIRVLTMIREPQGHVLSQYSHCTGAKVFRKNWHEVPPLAVWLRLHRDADNVTLVKEKTHCRYSPRDLQTSYLESLPEEAWFIGIMEKFQLSMCLLHYQLFRSIPKECHCNESQLIVQHRTHNLKRITASSLSDEAKEMIRHLTIRDHDLYQSAKVAFYQRIHAVEIASGMKILCEMPIK